MIRSNIVWKGCRIAACLTMGLLGAVASASAADGTLSNLVVAGLTPAFSPGVTQYTIPKTANCSVPVTATLANAAHTLYVASTQTASGATRSAWVCDGKTKIDIVVYQGWTEMGRYTVTPVAQATTPPPMEPAPPPPAPSTPPPAPPTTNGKLAGLVIANLSPAFNANVTQYTIPRTAACSVPVVATLANTANKLHVASTETPSGVARSAWVCDGKTKIDIVIYQVWTEVGRYTVNVVGTAPAAPDPMTPPAPSTPPAPPAVQTEATPQPSPLPAPPSTPLPTPTPVDAATAITLLNQATFGPSAVEVAAVQANGVDYWLEQQFRMPETPIADGLDVNALRSQVFLNMANAPDQVRQRVMFALGQVLVVSASKNVNGDELIPWVRMLSHYAFSNYRTLLRETTLSPSMGKFLDLANSRKAAGASAPNENFPRELLQLFGLGVSQLNQDGSRKADALGQPIPVYTQATLKDVARALTGWTYPTKPGALPAQSNQDYFVGLMEPRPPSHDTGAKTIVGGVVLPAGQSVTKDMEDVIDAIFQHPNVPPFVATRLIRSLVTSNPTPAYIKRVADVFVDNGQGVRGDMKSVVRAVLTDVDAPVAGSQDGHIKDPVLHIIGMGRALGAQITDPNIFMYLFANLGQQVLTPATVFSFYSPLASLPKEPTLFGPEFQLYTPALALQRANFIFDILSGQMTSAFKVDLAPYLALAADPFALVEKVNQALFFGRMSTDLRMNLVTATQAVASYNARERALGALYLAAISSEYAVYSGGLVQ